ncbi:hypothetical protein [Humibacter ginsengiterrae]
MQSLSAIDAENVSHQRLDVAIHVVQSLTELVESHVEPPHFGTNDMHEECRHDGEHAEEAGTENADHRPGLSLGHNHTSILRLM